MFEGPFEGPFEGHCILFFHATNRTKEVNKSLSVV